jgi:MFS transporter, UMF1 family
VLRSDGNTPCVAPATAAPSPDIGQGSSGSLLSLFARGLQTREGDQCVINLFGAQVNTSSFALYTFSLSVLVQALTLVSIGAIADHGKSHCIGDSFLRY